MQAKCSQCCSSSKKKREFEGVSCALSLNSAARRSHSAASCLSSNDMGTSTTSLNTGQIRSAGKCFLESSWIFCGEQCELINRISASAGLPIQGSVQLPASFASESFLQGMFAALNQSARRSKRLRLVRPVDPPQRRE